LGIVGTINQLSHDVNYGYDLLKSATTKEDYQKMKVAIDLNTKALESNVESLLTLSNSMRQKYLGVATLLRGQLKTYE
jgi:hypothetical protein